jgi:hypothetical protein
MTAVWNLDLNNGTEKLVLLAFADYANDDGLCFPSTDRIAYKTGVSKSQAARIIRSLIERGLIEVVEPGGRGLGDRRSVRIHPNKGVTMTPYRVSPCASRVSPCANKGVTMTPEPLVEPLVEPSVNNGGADRMKANELLAAWIDLQPLPPSAEHRKKQGAFAKRICDQYPAEAIHAAAAGMEKLYPYSKGEPWDLLILERKFSLAVQAEFNGRDRPTWLDEMFSETEES